MPYVILCQEPLTEMEASVLPDGAETCEQALLLAQSRAEEYIDEQTELAVEDGEDTPDFNLQVNKEALVVELRRESRVELRLSLVAVEIHNG